MQKFYKIDAVHPVLKRVVKSNLNSDDFVSLYKELQNAGYEDTNIQVDTCRIIYEEGDTLTITPEMFFAIPDSISELEVVTEKDRHLMSLKRSLRYMYGENPSHMVCKLISKRYDRKSGGLVCDWLGMKDDDYSGMSVHMLEPLGFEFKHPEFDVIPLEECDDHLLDDGDVVIKYLMIQNGLTESQAEQFLLPVYRAMNKAGSVFYRP